mmetsp:Transcript_27378/g.76481  ORF Transcript_27378/g.76481 Transcript_27378/m.76481 type:complete len:326 (-) Transcript_27378:497-1474(-)
MGESRRGAPRLLLVYGLSLRVSQVGVKVPVVGVGQADGGRGAGFPGVRALRREDGATVYLRVVPHDEVEALSGKNIRRPVPPRPEVNDTPPDLVRVAFAVLAVVGATEAAAEVEPGPCEILAQAHIESHLRVVRVHVQSLVLVLGVLHNEGVVRLQRSALHGEEDPGQGLQVVPLQTGEGIRQPNLVQLQPRLVHGIGRGHQQPGGLKGLHLLHQVLAKVPGEQGERVHSVRLLPHEVFRIFRPPCRVRKRQKVRCKRRPGPAGCAVRKQLRPQRVVLEVLHAHGLSEGLQSRKLLVVRHALLTFVIRPPQEAPRLRTNYPERSA